MTIPLRSLAISSLLLASVGLAQAQPANDSFENRISLAGTATSASGSNVGATTQGGEPNRIAGNRFNSTVWWTWTAPVSGTVRIDTVGSSFDTLLGVYTGNLGSLNLIADNNNGSGIGNASLVTFNAVQGTQYQILVASSRFGTTGTIQLNLNMPPSVAITSPTNGSLFVSGSPIPITATASSGAGTVTQVDFYRGGALIGSDQEAPYSVVLSNAPLGTNSLSAIVTDSVSQRGTSAVVRVVVLNVGVTLTAPTDGAGFANTNPITVSAVGLVPSGTMTNVEFFADGEKFGEDADSPFSAVWAGVSPGMHRLTATGMDDAGLAYTSAPVLISVARSLMPTGSVWNYLDNGSDQGTAWVAPDFDDSAWANGPAELGYGDDVDGRPEATVVGYGPDPDNKYVTTYFRHSFLVTNAAGYMLLVPRVLRDDGAVVYLNGIEAARFNMPSGQIIYTTLTSNATDDGTDFFLAGASASLLVEGTNVLAVEVHQSSLSSSDLSFDMELLALPVIVRNQSPMVALTSPTNGEYFLAPASLTLAADASDSDGTVALVEFYADGLRLGEATSSPYTREWLSPSVGWHVVQAIATDDQGARQASPLVGIAVYDAAATPLVAITSPANDAVFEGPTNLTITAVATAASGITNVLFLANDAAITSATASPYSVVWSNATFGTNLLTTVAYDAVGVQATSAAVRIIVNTPPLNTNPPTIFAVIPLKGAARGSLTNIQVTFSERVFNVDAADLLVNGVPAIAVTGSSSNYTFTVVSPPIGTVSITWASNHGITDYGWPSSLPFDAGGPGATWTYQIIDVTPPVIAGRTPPAGATVSNLTQIGLTFSEAVSGVDAADLLINDAPAVGLSGGGSNYLFSFAQPPPGSITVAWAANHGIADLATTPNAFNATGAGATWNYTLDTRTVLVASNANWMFIKGRAEASTPIDAWRHLAFDESSWSNSPAPFFYGDPYTNASTPGTLLSDMLGGYSSIYLRKTFVLGNAAAVTNLLLNAQSDDAFIAWINGVEVLRYNMPAGEIPYNDDAPSSINEPNSRGAAYILYTLSDPASCLVNGTNVLAVHAFNNQPNSSTDFGFNAQLYAYVADPTIVPPRISSVQPPAGEVFALTSIKVTFTEPVGGVDYQDLLINGQAADGVDGGTSNTTYTFEFPQPPYGPVSITWAWGNDIYDFDPEVKKFDLTAPGSSWQYTLLNPNAPKVAAQVPPAGATIGQLTAITVTFSKPVTGVDAADLRINGLPATGLSGSGATYTFTFPEPPYGPVTIGWISDCGIQDQEAVPFDPARPGGTWSYTLVDQTPPTLVAQEPPAGDQVTNLTQITVLFSEPVTGVNASDLRINGVPASTVSGSGATYTFTFAQPNATLVNLTWAGNHGIRDLAPAPNPFDANAPGASWFYTTSDNVPPALTSIDPPAGATVRSLAQITVTFTEPVTGVTTNALLINSVPPRSVSGSAAGPYTFVFSPPSNGPVEVRWAADHAVTDRAFPPNPFAGGEWTYLIDPNASFADKIVIHEIMFNPLSGQDAEEWIELHNIGAELVNLTGWRFTRGIDFTFPNVAIPSGGYLVVAADEAAFQAKYPTVTNVVGGRMGRLANNDETIELVTLTGEPVDRVHYAAEGDWARHERGHGADLVSRLSRNGSTATVNIFGHDYTAGDRVLISGADQPEYSGIFTVTSPTSDSFTISVPGTPASPATGTIICRQIVDNGASGWSWFSAADGFGSSLELVNPTLPHDLGQSWLVSTPPGGTPGQANSVFATNVAPWITDARHLPAVPRSTEAVTISARVQDEASNGVATVTLFWRDHSANYGANPPPFNSLPMWDDGAHSDGVAQDGLFAAELAAQANRAVIEFYIQASDTTGLTRTWPAPTWETNNTYGQLANALYQVDDESSTTNMPFLRVVLTETERAQLAGIDTASDAEMNATFVSLDGDGVRVRYNAGLRLRGAGSRSGQPKNYRVNFTSDHRWNGVSEINLNCRYIHAQLAGGAIAQKAGLPCADTRVVQLRLNGQNMATLGSVNYGSYLLVEPIGAEWAANHFPLDADGNVYRGSKYPWNANLDYLGTNAATYYGQTGAGYYKTSNRGENDWTDLFRLTYALSPNTLDADYVQAVSTNVNVEAWLLYFVVCNFFDYRETSLCIGVGDDYAMYRGVIDPRFKLVAHDFDTILGQGDTGGNTTRSIWTMVDNPSSTDPTQQATFLRRFMRHPEFAPIYFRLWKQHLDTTFAPEQINPLLDQVLGHWGAVSAVPAMKTFAANRRAHVLGQIPLNLTIEHSLGTPQNGYLSTTSPNLLLRGSANIIDTRRVRANGSLAAWSAWQGRWTNTVTLQPGINTVLVQSFNSNDVEFARANLDIWYDDGSVQSVSGALTADTLWTAANGPYQVTANLTVNAGVTLTIQPGTTVYLGSGVNLVVANGGRLLAEGTATAPIRFTGAPGTTATWGGITVNGAVDSPETRIAFAHIEGNGSTAIHAASGTVFLDHLSFGSTAGQYLSLDGSSFVVSDCVFPSAAAGAYFELVHGTGGIKSGGRGLFLRNFFGKANSISSDYNDVLDFSGGNRPGPIVQFINNVFIGTDDDHLDLDSTDAWIEGNIFLHAHRNGSPDTASGVSGGADNADTSEITIIGNLFYDCDQAAMAKQGNFFTLINNTIVRQTHQGGVDTDGAVVCLADEGTVEGAGMYLEGNIIYDAEKLVRNQTASIVTFTNNLMSLIWSGPGGNNSSADPLFKHVPQLAETTNFTSWAQAQVMWDWLSLRPGSPAIGAGPNGRDVGGVVPPGASIAGEPSGTTGRNSANLQVGVNRTGSGIPTTGWPDGSGFTHYRWRLDGGVWSAETPITTPISLAGLADGPHYVEVAGRNDAGLYQDDAALGADAGVTLSRTWTVSAGLTGLRLNELLAANTAAVVTNGKAPDLIELYNDGAETLHLAGIRLTDDPSDPDKFIFPPGATLPAGEYLIVFANSADGTPGFHLGFNLSQEGETIYLYDAAAQGGALLDSASFGPQLTDFSIGRLIDGSWALTVPTFGAPNRAAPVGDPTRLRINEWLALGQTPFNSDFIELYNADSVPVDLGGLHLSDEILGWPNRHQIATLSFIPGYGYLRFFADSMPEQGPEHLNFSLSGDQGAIGLYLPDLTPIDLVLYQAQQPNISQGRSPNGSSQVVFLDQPTPGAPNPLQTTAPVPLTLPIVAMTNGWRYEQSGTDLGTNWIAPGFDDSVWTAGPALLAVEDCGCLPYAINTPLSLTNGTGRTITYYFRTTFVAPTNGNITALQLSHVIDDGAIFYLNGYELLRFNMPEGAVTYMTQASAAPTDASLQGPVAVSAAALQPGTNVLAVEVHQNGAASSDVVFGLSLDALVVTNAAPAGSVVLNEVLAANASLAEADGSTADWVELYNQSSGLVDLSGLSLTDDTLQPRRWVFPDGAQIAPLGFLRLFCDGNRPASATNTGFGLRAAGGGVYLFDAPGNGGTLLTAITYGLQVADFSIGRVPDGSTNWVLNSPTPESLNRAITSLGDPAGLRVNEWMADPASGDDWFEIHNPNTQPVALGNLCLTDDLNSRTKHRISPLSFLGTGSNAWQKFVADRNTGAGADHVNFALSGGGEAVGLSTTSGALIDGYAFGPQQTGISEGRFPDGATEVVKFPGTESPGAANYRWLTNVVINEVLTHTPTNTPLEDAIELHNLSDQPLDVGGWWLSDDPGTLQKFQIPSPTTLPAHGFTVIYENQFTNRELPGVAIPFALSATGDEVVLSAATSNVLTGWRTLVRFGAADSAVSFGRYLTSTGEEEFVAMSARTFGVDDPGNVEEFRQGTGMANALPKVGPVVITEIMYRPPDLGTNDNVRDEFIELHNTSTAPVELYDPAYPTNGWRLRDAVDFDFPAGTVLPPGGYLVVVSFDPVNNPTVLEAFRAVYGLNTNTVILGPYAGKLANSSEDIELKKPGLPDTNDVPYVLVERVRYRDTAPWPIEADGLGASLQRFDSWGFGNDPANWFATLPSPGQPAQLRSPPVLAPIEDQIVAELHLIKFTATLVNSNAPGQSFTFSLGPGAPAGASITPTGLFRWWPSEAQGPGDYTVTVQVRDTQIPSLSDEQVFTVTVLELNSPPMFVDTLEKHVGAGATVSFPTAVDRDLPVQSLSFTSESAAESGVSIDPVTGRFTWVVPAAQPPGIYLMTLRATDDGSPVLSSDFTYTIHVYPPGQTVVVVQAQLLLDSLQLTWTATPGKTYQIQSTENLSPAAWAPLGPNLVADGPDMFAILPLSTTGQSLRVVQLD